MALKVTIHPSDSDFRGNYPIYFTFNNGVEVLPCGALKLTADRDADGNSTTFRIYAPGAWKEVNIEDAGDE